jgi:predicted DNA binding protein
MLKPLQNHHLYSAMTDSGAQMGGLDEGQRELLSDAVREGYFKVPRRTTLVELSDAHCITDREASERLRAALDDVLRECLYDAEDSPPD